MIVTLLGFVTLFRVIRNALGDPMARGLLILVAVVLAVGTVFYHQVEDWSVVDALYFSVVALLTVGFGDYVPTTTLSKLFTIGYLFVGVGIIAAAATTVVQRSHLWTRLEDAEHAAEEDKTGPQP
jgi:hypothetical protein